MTTTARRRRTSTSRAVRQYRGYHVSRVITFVPALALPLWGWRELREPFRYEGLGALELTGLMVVPVLILAVLYFLPAAARAGFVPRDWRKNYRKRHGREGARSAYISNGLKRLVFRADRYRCVACGKTWEEAGHLEIDHVMPWSLGGLTTLFNCMSLCPACNKIKSNYWRYRRSGRAVYVPFPGWVNEAAAAQILAAELLHRRNPFRLLRSAWALGA